MMSVRYITLAVSDRNVNHRRFHSKCDLYGSSADDDGVLCDPSRPMLIEKMATKNIAK